ncbi:hypothetical protein Pcinc_031964 [Petrolisthes cinctipes]|uniref:Uncharacterized protein n=1 Tax=Petrolisthes cinctipes TaxID=88211 RepID=A0AAE1K433_PETCI|nr:hypothetical protein Pcinc_031964 [Petrolisthes cinctipes]
MYQRSWRYPQPRWYIQYTHNQCDKEGPQSSWLDLENIPYTGLCHYADPLQVISDTTVGVLLPTVEPVEGGRETSSGSSPAFVHHQNSQSQAPRLLG